MSKVNFKLFFLADGASAHTEKWVKGLLERGCDIFLFSLRDISPAIKDLEKKHKLKTFSCEMLVQSNASAFDKSTYLKVLPQLKKQIAGFKPDLLHVHYASSYGLLALLSGFRPYVASVWGSDIMVFPKRSVLHKILFKRILRRTKAVYATSKLMLSLVGDLGFRKKAKQIPFGIEMQDFQLRTYPSDFSALKFCIVKTLAPTYGIDIAIEAFRDFHQKYPTTELHIAGSGALEEEYKQVAGDELDRSIFFHGHIAYSEVPTFLSTKDVFVNVSRSESFGVSVIEAAAVGLPAIISNRGGLPETVIDGKTGLICQELSAEAVSTAMEEMMKLGGDIKTMGLAAREFVGEQYDFAVNLQSQLESYQEVIDANR